MSNRTDFDALADELALSLSLHPVARDRIASELHNAFVAGQEVARDEDVAKSRAEVAHAQNGPT